jgi:hypothetical protein
MTRKTREEHLAVATETIGLNVMSYNSLSAEGKIRQRSRIAAQISQTIWLIPYEKSGFISEKALAAVMADEIKYSQLTKEHYNPRLSSGLKILDLFSTIKYDEKILFELLREYSRVHIVLAEENQELKRRTSKKHPLKDATHQEQYRGLDNEEPIVLVADPFHMAKASRPKIERVVKPKRPKKVWGVSSANFQSIKDVCKLYNITPAIAYYRFAAKNYPDWNVRIYGGA